MAELAAADPCLVPRGDLLRLLAMAGMSNTTAYWTVINSKLDPVTVEAGELLRVVGMVR